MKISFKNNVYTAKDVLINNHFNRKQLAAVSPPRRQGAGPLPRRSLFPVSVFRVVEGGGACPAQVSHTSGIRDKFKVPDTNRKETAHIIKHRSPGPLHAR